MAAVDCCNGRRRFAAACGVLSRCVKAHQAAAHARPATTATAASATMLLLPGADVVAREEADGGAAPPPRAQLTIMYAGRVVVFDDVPADRAAELLRVAARQDDVTGGTEDIPVARKASLQRFMDKRRHRLAAQAPYGDAAGRPSVASSKSNYKRQQEEDAGAWLGLGIPGGCACADASSPRSSLPRTGLN